MHHIHLLLIMSGFRINSDELCSAMKLQLLMEQLRAKDSLPAAIGSTNDGAASGGIKESERTEDLTRHIPKPDSDVKYGAASSNLPGHLSLKYYLTTAIAYTNGYPHIGHAYEVLLSY